MTVILYIDRNPGRVLVMALKKEAVKKRGRRKKGQGEGVVKEEVGDVEEGVGEEEHDDNNMKRMVRRGYKRKVLKMVYSKGKTKSGLKVFNNVGVTIFSSVSKGIVIIGASVFSGKTKGFFKVLYNV